MRINTKFLVLLVLMLAFFIQFANAQEQPKFRKYSGNGLKLEVAPLGLDQVRGFFIGRDFSPKDADFIAKTGCIFRSSIGNAGKNADESKITVQLGKWQVIYNGEITSVKTREIWADIWTGRNLAETPKIAFHWALFPTLQNYKPSDYNWGLISFALPPESVFDLQLVWLQDGVEQKHILKDLKCGK